MSASPESRIVALTDALLAVARAENPDLDLVVSLVQQRGEELGLLPPPLPSERGERFAVLQRVQAADAEIRSRFVERHAQVRDELRMLMLRPRYYSPRQPRSRLIDQRV